MILYRGHEYRQALTPEQKKLKKQYHLEQQQTQAKEIPNWEEMYEEHSEDMHTYIHDSGLMDNFQDEWDQQYEGWIDAGAEPERAEQEAENYTLDLIVREHFEPFYYDVVRRVNRLGDRDCWRAVALPVGADPATHSDLGIYWTMEQESATAFWSDTTKQDQTTVVFHAKVNGDYIDAAETVGANMFGIANNIEADENEVRFFKYAPIWIYSVELEDGTYVEIEDWRTT